MNLLKSVVVCTVLSIAVIGCGTPVKLKHEGSSSSGIRVSVKNGVATLYGHADSNFERIQAGNAARKLDGVTRVRNLLTF